MRKHSISISIIGFFFLFGRGFCSEMEDARREAKEFTFLMQETDNPLQKHPPVPAKISTRPRRNFPPLAQASGKGWQEYIDQQTQEIARLRQEFADLTQGPDNPWGRHFGLRAQELERLARNLATFEQDGIKSEAIAYSQRIARDVASYKYCKTVDEAALFSSAIENSQKMVDDFFVQSSVDLLLKELSKFSEDLSTFSRDIPGGEPKSHIFTYEHTIEEVLSKAKDAVIPTLFEPFLLKHGDPLLEFTALTTTTDDVTLPTFVYFSPQEDGEAKLPCVVWIHGGGMHDSLNNGSSFVLHIEAPDQAPPNMEGILSWLRSNMSSGLQALARFLAANGVAFATVEFDPKAGKSNVCKQIMDQVEAIKGLSYIDPDQMILCGHSLGGYILSLLVANYHEFLRDNFKSIAFVSPLFNEAWGAVNFQDSDYLGGNQNQSCFPNFAIPDGEAHLRGVLIDGKQIMDVTISEILYHKVPEARRILQLTYPFSPTIGIGDEELRPKLASLPPVFILQGTADSNTLPATQAATFAWRLKGMKLPNWLMLAYPNASHLPYRLLAYAGNPPSLEGFKQMLSDTLQIAQFSGILQIAQLPNISQTLQLSNDPPMAQFFVNLQKARIFDAVRMAQSFNETQVKQLSDAIREARLFDDTQVTRLFDAFRWAQTEITTRGTQDFITLSNGPAPVYDLNGEKHPMRSFAEHSFFLRLREDNETEWVPFKETEFGREILDAMAPMDMPSGPPAREE
ncbi:MAG: hypothetical protein LBB05_00510 [Puniceicoccales bacterium]|jgi:acetyl esterase/lipase|nr:hypothetical protein [Puniceicoccales bacterium]